MSVLKVILATTLVAAFATQTIAIAPFDTLDKNLTVKVANNLPLSQQLDTPRNEKIKQNLPLNEQLPKRATKPSLNTIPLYEQLG